MTQIPGELNIKELSIEERILLIEEIWNSIEAEQEMLELTEEQKEELDRRIESYRKSPGEGVTWEVVMARLTSEK